ncbi:hypothetical protein [Corynebacterium sp.]|uniref:hypothetical protein n=1 Tax=Corynebacterium sp. TaxID=1720 RepID=UPI002A91E87C|nr:hypothetical protein [Corynebacterium sp.]MDY5784490.1 hypothetical protein [Corynebacterium sp.]
MRRRIVSSVCAVAVLSACAPAENQDDPFTRPVVTSTTTTMVDPAPATGPVTDSPEPEVNPLQALADSVANTYGGSVGVAVAGDDVSLVGGDDGAYPAWSTIKVPIAIAAARTAPVEAEIFTPAAIQSSDNMAAESLWNAVSPGDVNQVLADAGVAAAVNTEKTRQEFSVFGQTLLTASQEAQLASGIGCIAGALPVVELMGAINPGQAYGLGQLPGARLKGGWGPSPSGGYHVRQLARVTNSRSEIIALGLTVIPASGDYATAQTMATAVAEGLRPLLDDLPTTTC